MTNQKTQTVDVNDVSHISSGTTIKGEVSSVNDIRVDGNVEGKVYTEGRVVVGEGAKVSGTLVCGNLDTWGEVEGEIYAKEVLSIKNTAVIKGNLHICKLQVELGARFEGNCKMLAEGELSEQQ